MSKSPQRPWITERNPEVSNSNPGVSVKPAKEKRKKDKSKSLLEKRTASVSRWLHIYLSMVSFVIVLFFAVTGLTLNHADWFADQVKTTELKGKMNAKWLNDPDTAKINKLQIVELLRSRHGIKGALGDFRMEDSEVSLSFKGPGYSSDAFIERKSGKYELTETKMGLVAVLNDLHKGRDSGEGWAWVIDVSAVFMSLVSMTGLILILFLKRKRTSGLILMVVGAILCYLIYKVFVP